MQLILFNNEKVSMVEVKVYFDSQSMSLNIDIHLEYSMFPTRLSLSNLIATYVSVDRE